MLSEAFWLKMIGEVEATGKASQVVEMIVEKYGIGRNTVYKNLRQYGWNSNRKTRSDAFEISEEMRLHLERVAYYYHTKGREHGKESRTPLERAMQMYVESFPAGSRPQLPDVSTVYKWLRRLEISRRDAIIPTPKIQIRPLFSNHVHQYDTSVCRYYLDADKQIKYISNAQDYKNKAGRYDNKRRLIRHLMLCLLTGAFYVEYSTSQQTLDVADFFYRAWTRKEDEFIFHGVPFQLWTDNDSVLRSFAIRRLLEYLEVEYPNVTPHHPWVKGAVEQAHLNWERWFESGFLFQKSGDIDEINAWAYDYAIRFQKERVHSRHKMTRFQAWDLGIAGHLRETPDYHRFMQLLHLKPEPRKIDSAGRFSFKGKFYEVEGIYSTWADIVVHPYLYKKNGAVTLQYPSRKLNVENLDPRTIQTLTVIPIEEDKYGLNKKNGVIPGTYNRHKKTESERNFDKVKAVEPETVVQPFGQNAERVAAIQFLNRVGTVLKAGAEVEYTAIEYSKIRAKKELAGRLRRALTQEESDYISQTYKDKISVKEIDKLEAEFRRSLEQSKEA